MENFKNQVTVYCLAYNHEKFIRKTLEGFVSQKTDFGFKVIVHDDASTDGTADIIREYAEKYPHIIFPIYQTENQYSKGVKIFFDIIAPLIDTEYVAVCEGDDYWCDENKLQMQLDYMIKHPECSMCVHNTRLINEDGDFIGRNVNLSNDDMDISADEIIAAGGGVLFHTSSFIYRKQDRCNMPPEYYFRGVGDYTLSIYLSTIGKVHYIGRVMSAYRVAVSDGWTSRLNKDRKKAVMHMKDMVHYLNVLDGFTEGKYHNGFERGIKRYDYFAYVMDDKAWKIIFKKDYKEHFLRDYPTLKGRITLTVKGFVKTILRALRLRK